MTPPPSQQQCRVISRATVIYATVAVFIGILILTIVCFTLLALLVASSLFLPFSPIFLAKGFAIAASSAAFATSSVFAITMILTLWWFVPSLRMKVAGIFLWVQWVVSEGWKRGKKVGCVGDTVGRAGRKVKNNKTLSSFSQTVDKTVARCVEGGLSILGEVGKKLKGGGGVLGLGGRLLQQVVKGLKANGVSNGFKSI